MDRSSNHRQVRNAAATALDVGPAIWMIRQNRTQQREIRRPDEGQCLVDPLFAGHGITRDRTHAGVEVSNNNHREIDPLARPFFESPRQRVQSIFILAGGQAWSSVDAGDHQSRERHQQPPGIRTRSHDRRVRAKSCTVVQKTDPASSATTVDVPMPLSDVDAAPSFGSRLGQRRVVPQPRLDTHHHRNVLLGHVLDRQVLLPCQALHVPQNDLHADRTGLVRVTALRDRLDLLGVMGSEARRTVGPADSRIADDAVSGSTSLCQPDPDAAA